MKGSGDTAVTVTVAVLISAGSTSLRIMPFASTHTSTVIGSSASGVAVRLAGRTNSPDGRRWNGLSGDGIGGQAGDRRCVDGDDEMPHGFGTDDGLGRLIDRDEGPHRGGEVLVDGAQPTLAFGEADEGELPAGIDHQVS